MTALNLGHEEAGSMSELVGHSGRCGAVAARLAEERGGQNANMVARGRRALRRGRRGQLSLGQGSCKHWCIRTRQPVSFEVI